MDENENEEPLSELAEPPDGFWEAVEEPEVSPESAAREAVQEQLEDAAKQRKGAFLEVNVSRNKGIVSQLSALTGQLTRLALAVENLLEQAYGFRSQPGKMGGEAPGVEYTDQDKFDIAEALEAAKDLEKEGDHD